MSGHCTEYPHSSFMNNYLKKNSLECTTRDNPPCSSFSRSHNFRSYDSCFTVNSKAPRTSSTQLVSVYQFSLTPNASPFFFGTTTSFCVSLLANISNSSPISSCELSTSCKDNNDWRHWRRFQTRIESSDLCFRVLPSTQQSCQVNFASSVLIVNRIIPSPDNQSASDNSDRQCHSHEGIPRTLPEESHFERFNLTLKYTILFFFRLYSYRQSNCLQTPRL